MKKYIAIFICLIALLSSSHVVNSQYENNKELYQVGEIKISLLEQDEFEALYGKSWVLMDGRDISKTEFASLSSMSNLPDARGKFLRMNNNGASGEDYDQQNDRTLGSYQKDSYEKHRHEYEKHHDSSGYGLGGSNGGNSSHSSHTTYSGDSETRPKNISVNFYIKVSSCKEEAQPCL